MPSTVPGAFSKFDNNTGQDDYFKINYQYPNRVADYTMKQSMAA